MPEPAATTQPNCSTPHSTHVGVARKEQQPVLIPMLAHACVCNAYMLNASNSGTKASLIPPSPCNGHVLPLQLHAGSLARVMVLMDTAVHI